VEMEDLTSFLCVAIPLYPQLPVSVPHIHVSNVTTGLSRTVSETDGNFNRKLHIFHTPRVFYAPAGQNNVDKFMIDIDKDKDFQDCKLRHKCYRQLGVKQLQKK